MYDVLIFYLYTHNVSISLNIHDLNRSSSCRSLPEEMNVGGLPLAFRRIGVYSQSPLLRRYNMTSCSCCWGFRFPLVNLLLNHRGYHCVESTPWESCLAHEIFLFLQNIKYQNNMLCSRICFYDAMPNKYENRNQYQYLLAYKCWFVMIYIYDR